jgi:hypothetical protein
MKVFELERILQNALDELEGYNEDETLVVYPNTYGVNIPFVAVRDGYVSLKTIETEEEKMRAESNKITFSDLKRHLVKEEIDINSFRRELFELIEDWIDTQNSEGNPDFSDERVIAFAKDEAYPELNFEKMIKGMLEEYKDTASPEVLCAMKNSLIEAPSMFTDTFHDLFIDAAGIVASSLSIDS